MDLTPVMKQQILSDWQCASHGQKRRVLANWADSLGCTVKTLYLCIPKELKGDRKARAGTPKIAGIAEAALVVAQIKRRPPKGKRLIITEQAIQAAVDNGKIPAQMLDVSVSTFNEHMRKLGMDKRNHKVVRFQADYPNQLHHIDASGSDCFYVKKPLPDGDAILKLDARPYKGYKNKPKDPYEDKRLWIYGLVDDHSGLMKARYVTAKGESCRDNMDFLSWAWSEIGLPEVLKSDHGPMMSSEAAKDFIKRLSIEVDPSVPLKSEPHGKIERPWRTTWQRFETPFYLENHKTFEIRLSELRRRFGVYLESYNNMAHRYEKKVSRLNVWKRVSLRGGIVKMPENAIATTAKRYSRKVENDGCFALHGESYEVKGLHDAQVWVLQGLFDDRLVVQDKATGEKYEVETFKPLSYGTYKGQKETPDEVATKAARNLKAVNENGVEQGLRNTLYTDPADKGNVAQFPVRIKETRQVSDVLDANTYPSVKAAIKDFIAISGKLLDMESREVVKNKIIEKGLNKTFVREFALALQADEERRVQNGN